MIFHKKKCLKHKKYIIVTGSEWQVAARALSLWYTFLTSAYFQQHVLFLCPPQLRLPSPEEDQRSEAEQREEEHVWGRRM